MNWTRISDLGAFPSLLSLSLLLLLISLDKLSTTTRNSSCNVDLDGRRAGAWSAQ